MEKFGEVEDREVQLIANGEDGAGATGLFQEPMVGCDCNCSNKLEVPCAGFGSGHSLILTG